jgi:hypothetical protein
MGVPAGTFQTYQTIGIREELSDVIYNISPEDTPGFSNAGRGSVDNTLYEWQTDSLAAAVDTNAQIEGDDAVVDTSDPTLRLKNYTQISRKTVGISGTNERVKKAGRKSELAYQLAKRSAELKRDMEKTLFANQGAVAGNAGTARKTGTLLAFIKTNTNKGGSGTDPIYTDTPTDPRNDGTQRPFEEDLLKDVLQKVWGAGGKPKIVIAGPINKMNASLFLGIAQIRKDAPGTKPATIIGAADVYVSDFGPVTFVPSRFQRERDVFVLDPEMYSIEYLRPFFTKNLADTGDSTKKLLLVEWGVRVNNEAGLGLVADLGTTIIVPS